MKKRILAMLLTACMVLTLLPAAVFADDAGALTVTAADGSTPTFENGVWKLADGTYTVSGTAADSESIELTGDVTVNLQGATLKHTTADTKAYAPAIDVASGKATLVLTGENAVEGSLGYAGIHVAKDASLTISGEGSLTAKGGDGSDVIRNVGTRVDYGFDSSVTSIYFGGGAGIGGNGMWMQGNDNAVGNTTADCGTIILEGGVISATGGKANIANAGGGAGIGGGGASTKDKAGPYPSTASIEIKGGTVTAVGGDGENMSLTGGGAGIGVGGATGSFYTQSSVSTVTISGGTVTASGTADGAGIGGGANVDGGTITITGGTVNATGGCELDDGKQDGGYGGAGIGGGDMGGVTAITITGGTITSRAIGAAAGIGAGDDGIVGTITGTDDDGNDIIAYGTIHIGGDANVTAYGGSHAKRTNGGAGIGNGRSYNVDGGFGEIIIDGSATVRAFAGVKAQAIGVGTYYGGDFPNKIHFGADTINVWMFNQDTEMPAFYGQGTDTVTTDGATPVWYTIAADAAFPTVGTTAQTTSTDNIYDWVYTEDHKVQLKDQDTVLTETSYPETFTLGNWATVYTKNVTVSYDLADGTAADGVSYDAETVKAGAEVTAKAAPSKSGYVFAGWKLDGTDTVVQAGEGFTASADTKLVAQWTEISQWIENNVETDVAVEVDVTGGTGSQNAELSDASKQQLQDSVKLWLQDLLDGKTPSVLGDTDAAALKALLQSKNTDHIKVILTVNAVLSDEKVEDLMGNQLLKDESGQVWELSVELSAQAYKGTELAKEEGPIALHELDKTIAFQLTTGLDLANNQVRVLYLHNDELKTADYTLDTDKGIVSLNAKQFSPYIVLVRPKDKTPDLDKSEHFAYIQGYKDGTVRPNRNITRAEVATIFFRLLTDESRTKNWASTNSYSDVSNSDWCNIAISTLSNMGVLKGYADGTFRPSEPVTRAQFAAIAARFSDAEAEGNTSFSDVPDTYWAAKEIAKAEQLGWIKGYTDGTFRPGKTITRAEAITMVNRVLERAVNADGLHMDAAQWSDNPDTGKWPYYDILEATNSHEFIRTDEQVPDQSFCYEKWTEIKPNKNWAELEKQWKEHNEAK